MFTLFSPCTLFYFIFLLFSFLILSYISASVCANTCSPPFQLSRNPSLILSLFFYLYIASTHTLQKTKRKAKYATRLTKASDKTLLRLSLSPSTTNPRAPRPPPPLFPPSLCLSHSLRPLSLFLSLSLKMGFGVVFSSIFVVWLILISFLVSPVHSSRSCISSGLQSHETTIAAPKRAGSVAQDHQIVRLVKRKGEADASNFGLRRKLLGQAPFGSDSPIHDDTKPGRRKSLGEAPFGSDSPIHDDTKPGRRKSLGQAPFGSDSPIHDGTKPGRRKSLVQAPFGSDSPIHDGTKPGRRKSLGQAPFGSDSPIHDRRKLLGQAPFGSDSPIHDDTKPDKRP